MPASPPIPAQPVTSVADAVACMQAIGAALPASDGPASGLFLDGLAETTALASRLLLTAV